jgi:hypothetical protein
MRKYLGWDAKSFSLAQTYLNYETDGIISQDNIDDARDFAGGADLLIFQDYLFRVPGFRLDKIAKPRNTIIYGLGSLMRDNLNAVMDYVKVGWTVAAPISDPTISRYIGGSPFEMVMIDERIHKLTENIKRNEKVTICHAPTKEKGAEVFMDAINNLDVEWLLIKGKRWEDAIKLKATAHILLDSLTDSSYGISILESLYMGQQCAGNISNWCYALNPDLPVTNTTLETMKTDIERMITSLNNQEEECNRQEWAKKFLPKNKIIQWERFIKYTMEYHK